MICLGCGTWLPDGTRQCPKCGTMTAASSEAGETDILYPNTLADVHDGSASDPSGISDASQGVLYDGYGANPADGGWGSVSPPTTVLSPNPSSSSFGGSTVTGHAFMQPDTPPAAKKPLYARWWFWLVVVVIIAVAFALRIASGTQSATPAPDGSETAQAEPKTADAAVPSPDKSGDAVDTSDDDADEVIPIPDIPKDEDVVPDDSDTSALDIDDVFVPMELLTAQIEEKLNERGLEYHVWVDDDDWVIVDIWQDGIGDLAEAAYAGDADALEQWQATAEDFRGMSAAFLSDLLSGGQHSAVCIVRLLDETETTLLIAIDGELILDLATGLDMYGLMEDQ